MPSTFKGVTWLEAPLRDLPTGHPERSPRFSGNGHDHGPTKDRTESLGKQTVRQRVSWRPESRGSLLHGGAIWGFYRVVPDGGAWSLKEKGRGRTVNLMSYCEVSVVRCLPARCTDALSRYEGPDALCALSAGPALGFPRP